MMIKHSYYLILIIVFFANKSQAQDVHYSMFDLISTNLSPSETGQFNGDYRLSGIYRNQWRSVTVPFVSSTFNAEYRSIFKALPNLHTGIQITSDVAGDSRYRQFFLNLSFAYDFLLGSDSNSTLSLGLQSGLHRVSIDYDALNFNSQYNGIFYDPSLSSGEIFNNDGVSSPNLNFGVSYRKKLTEKLSLTSTASIHNIISKKNSFELTGATIEKKANISLGANYIINDKFELIPRALISPQGKYRKYLYGSDLKYTINNTLKFSPQNIYFGLWSRANDAFIVSLGADYNDFHAKISYDINYSNFTPATNRRGGLELGLVYIFKKVPIVHYKRCPDYI